MTDRLKLTRPQMRRLSRYECWGCEQLLDKVQRSGCSSMFRSCGNDVINERARSCLADSKHPHIAVVEAVSPSEICSMISDMNGTNAETSGSS